LIFIYRVFLFFQKEIIYVTKVEIIHKKLEKKCDPSYKNLARFDYRSISFFKPKEGYNYSTC
jgi:hypothetical protein